MGICRQHIRFSNKNQNISFVVFEFISYSFIKIAVNNFFWKSYKISYFDPDCLKYAIFQVRRGSFCYNCSMLCSTFMTFKIILLVFFIKIKNVKILWHSCFKMLFREQRIAYWNVSLTFAFGTYWEGHCEEILIYFKHKIIYCFQKLFIRIYSIFRILFCNIVWG